MKPRLVQEPLSGRIVCVTRYKDKGRYIVASDKRYVYDVTEDFAALRKRRVRLPVRAVLTEEEAPRDPATGEFIEP